MTCSPPSHAACCWSTVHQCVRRDASRAAKSHRKDGTADALGLPHRYVLSRMQGFQPDVAEWKDHLTRQATCATRGHTLSEAPCMVSPSSLCYTACTEPWSAVAGYMHVWQCTHQTEGRLPSAALPEHPPEASTGGTHLIRTQSHYSEAPRWRCMRTRDMLPANDKQNNSGGPVNITYTSVCDSKAIRKSVCQSAGS